MTNAITSTSHDVDGYTTSDFRTEDQWLGEATEHRGKKRELIRLAYVNKFDFSKSQRKLAKMLGCSQSTVSEHVDNLLATGELTKEHYQKKMCYSRKPEQTDRFPIKPVENSTPLIHPEIDHDVTNAESSNTELSFSEVVSDAQPKMGTSYHGCSKGAVPMDTADARRAAEDLEEIVRLLNIVGQLTARNCDIRGSHFTEEQWYLVWASLDSEAREAKMRCRNYEAAIQRDCATIRAGAQARFGSGMGSDAAVF